MTMRSKCSYSATVAIPLQYACICGNNVSKRSELAIARFNIFIHISDSIIIPIPNMNMNCLPTLRQWPRRVATFCC